MERAEMHPDLAAWLDRTFGEEQPPRLLGEGALGITYLGYSARSPETPVAIKVFWPSWAPDEERTWFRNHFTALVQHLGTLSSPHLPRLWLAAEEGELIYWVTTFVGDPAYVPDSLVSRLQQGPLGLVDGARLCQEAAAALTTLHLNALVHGNVQPSNILFDATGQVVLTDAGVAGCFAPAARPTLLAAYRAPELATEPLPTERSDQYALATVVLHALAGQAALDEERAEAEAGPAEAVWPAAVPTAAREILRRARHPDPQQRFATVTEFAQAFQGTIASVLPQPPAVVVAVSGQGTHAPPITSKSVRQRRPLRHPVVAFSVFLVILLVLGSSGVVTYTRFGQPLVVAWQATSTPTPLVNPAAQACAVQVADLLPIGGGPVQAPEVPFDVAPLSITTTPTLFPLLQTAAQAFDAANRAPTTDGTAADQTTVAEGMSASALADVASPSTIDSKEYSAQIAGSDLAVSAFADPEKTRFAMLVDHPVAVVPYTLVVSPYIAAGPAPVTNLTHDQLEAIFSGAITNWRQLGGPDEPLAVMTLAQPENIDAVFARDVLQAATVTPPTGAQRAASPADLLARVAAQPGAIGYLPVAALAAPGAASLVTPLCLAGVGATPSHIADGTYPFWDYAHIYTLANMDATTRAFLNFLASPTFQSQAVPANGLLPLATLSDAARRAHQP